MPDDRTKNNSFFGNSFLIFIARFFPSLANLTVFILYSRTLPVDVYGTYQHFWIQLFIIYPFICLGTHVLMVTYTPAQLSHLLRIIPARGYVCYTGWCAVLCAVFASLQYHAIPVGWGTSFAFIGVYAASVVLEAFLVVVRSFRWLIVINTLYAAAFIFAHIWLLYTGFSLQLLFGLLLAASVIRLLAYVLLTVRQVQLAAGHTDVSVTIPLRQVRLLWMHLGFYDISQMLFSYIDKFIISLVLSAGLSAVYYNGSQNIPFLPILLSAAGNAVLMQLAGGRKQDEVMDTVRLMNRSGKVFSCLVFPLFFFLLIFSGELFSVLLVHYNAAVPIFIMSVLVIPLRAYSFTTVLQRLHKGRIINAGAIADLLLACALMYPMYRWLGLPGVALSFVISTYLQAFFYLYYSGRLLGVSMFTLLPAGNWAIKLIVFCALFVGVHYMFVMYFTPVYTLILGMTTAVATAAVSLWIELKRKDNHVGFT